MASKDKRIIKILNNPKDVRFKELDSILLDNGYQRRQSGGGSSHYVYSHIDSDVLVVLVAHGSNAVLPEYQVKKALNSIKNIKDK